MSSTMTDEEKLEAATRWLADLMCRPEEALIGQFGNSLSRDGLARLLAVMGDLDQPKRPTGVGTNR